MDHGWTPPPTQFIRRDLPGGAAAALTAAAILAAVVIAAAHVHAHGVLNGVALALVLACSALLAVDEAIDAFQLCRGIAYQLPYDESAEESR